MRHLFGITVLLILGWAAASEAQPLATSQHRFAWEQTGDVTGVSFEVAMDAQPYAPVLGVSCAAGTCGGSLPQSITAGLHQAVLRAVRVVDGIRQVSSVSNTLAFIYVNNPDAPGNLRIVPPAGPTAAVLGTVRERYPFAGLDVARIWLDAGADVYVGAASLAAGGYTVQPGDRAGIVFLRPE